MSTKLPVRACSAVTMLALVACASTEFKNTWKAPDAAPLSAAVTQVTAGASQPVGPAAPRPGGSRWRM